MDFALKLAFFIKTFKKCCSFNPCFDGFCSKTGSGKERQGRNFVSILVLMDFALKPRTRPGDEFNQKGFNPCFDGFCSKTLAIDGRDKGKQN